MKETLKDSKESPVEALEVMRRARAPARGSGGLRCSGRGPS